jgi:DNA-directed RNA polymerase subunit RPC12/RpoP
MRIEPLLQYFCSTCGRVLKETSSLDLSKDQLTEECPSCGSLLVEMLQNRRLSSSLLQQKALNNTIRKPAEGLSSDFQVAYQQVESNAIKLYFDIDKLDSLLNLGSHGSLCIIGEQMYTQLLIDRLCVHSMLPKRHGGIGTGYSKIWLIDAGNSSDVYQIVNFARQYGLDVKRVLQNILVSRVFTIYQLAHLVIYELPKIIERLSHDRKNYLIVVYGLLHLFESDPHLDKQDAKWLLKEIGASIRNLSDDRFVLVSTSRTNQYEKSLLSAFDNVINITNGIGDNGILQVKVDNHILRKRKQFNWLTLKKNELRPVPAS